MIDLSIYYQNDRTDRLKVNTPFLIGRALDCDVSINHWRVAKKHVRIERVGDELFAQDLGSLLGTQVNEKRIGTYGPLQQSDRLIVGPCLIQITDLNKQNKASRSAAQVLVPDPVEQQAQTRTVSIENQIIQTSRLETSSPTEHSRAAIAPSLFTEMHTTLMQSFDLRKLDVTVMADESLAEKAGKYLRDFYELDSRFQTQEILDGYVHQVVEESLGLGLISDLLKDASVSEIMVNRFDEVYVERHGRITACAQTFSSEASLKVILDRIVTPVGRRLDDASPMVDARLADGSRINAVLSPIATKGISLTVRKFGVKDQTISSLLRTGFIDSTIAGYLNRIVNARLNLLVAGGTGSGKTTLLNVLSNSIDKDQRIVTIEDSAELKLNHPHVVSLESRAANAEGSGAITIRDLVKNSMRMRPDRIIVGEVRGAEALDMVLALNTGHDGSFTTLHANTPRDALKRLEALVLLAAPNLPFTAIKELIASAFQVVIQIKRNNAGIRRITAISEIVGSESGTFLLQPVVSWDEKNSHYVYPNLPSCHLTTTE